MPCRSMLDRWRILLDGGAVGVVGFAAERVGLRAAWWGLVRGGGGGGAAADLREGWDL